MLIWHCFVGNDVPVWMVAVCRGVLSALIAGAVSFFAVWQTTDEIKTLVTAGIVPFLTTLSWRFGLEGAIDNWKQDKPERKR